ncbi:MAG: DNA-directed RNA polymerase subunit omega [Abditibacteriota bacterium]|nr:DNA-directed RNA polymerase subunit omega [Abditibacteriota bacterium]
MIFPAADKLEKMDKYALVILAAKRSKQIKAGADPVIDTKSENPITVALEEIAAGKITTNISREDEIIPTTPSQVISADIFAADEIPAVPVDNMTEEELIENIDLSDIETGEEINLEDDLADTDPVDNE